MRHSKIPNDLIGFIVSADDIGGRDVSEDSARRGSRNGKHKFLHFHLSFICLT